MENYDSTSGPYAIWSLHRMHVYFCRDHLEDKRTCSCPKCNNNPSHLLTNHVPNSRPRPPNRASVEWPRGYCGRRESFNATRTGRLPQSAATAALQSATGATTTRLPRPPELPDAHGRHGGRNGPQETARGVQRAARRKKTLRVEKTAGPSAGKPPGVAYLKSCFLSFRASVARWICSILAALR